VSRPCNITVALEHDTAPTSTKIYLTTSTAQTYPLNLNYKSNNELKIFDALGQVVCDLSLLDVHSCKITFKVNVLAGDNNGGTHIVAEQSKGVIEIFSECKSIKEVHATQANFFRLSLIDRTKVNPAILAGYEVRDPPLQFDLPYVVPILRSGDNIVTQCGPLVYTVDIVSAYSPRDAFDVVLAPVSVENVTSSANVTVSTNTQEYALFSGLATGNYSTLYEFRVSASFTKHSE